MGQSLYESFNKLDEIVNTIKAMYSHTIISQQDDGEDGIIFTFSKEHNIRDGGVVKITGALLNGLSSEYNDSFKVESITSPTAIRVLKHQEDLSGIEIEYNENVDFSSAELTNIRVYDDPTYEFPVSDYPVVLVDVDDTEVINGASGMFFTPDQTFFPISVFHRLYNFEDGLGQLRACRYFVAQKLQEILDNLNLEIASNVSRLETIWGSENVSVIGATVKK